jgi:hypothetical protein
LLERSDVRTTTLVLFVVVLVFVCSACADSQPSNPPRAVPRRDPTVGTHVTRTFYVARGGDDAAPGSRRRPWKSLGFSMARLRAGDRLFVRDGTYRERIKLRPHVGRPGARIVVEAYPGERPVVVGQLWLGDASYWTVDGINVTWAADNPTEPMVRMYGGTDWVLSDAEIWGAHATSALHVDDGPRNDLGRWTVTGNCIHDTYPTTGTNQDHNVYVDDMSSSPDPRGLIEHNILFNAPNGRGIKLGPGGTQGGARNVVIRDNTVFKQMANISLSQATSGITITRNVLVGATDTTIDVFELRGADNVAYDNVTGFAPRLVERSSDARPITERDNHVDIDPGFDRVGCDGFHPSSWRGYGRYG